MTERVGIVASCFDLFHAGHILMLTEAKENCDRLVVALQSDPTIDRLVPSVRRNGSLS